MTISRFVALITPLLAAAAGYVSVQVAQLPGAPVLDSRSLTIVFVSGAASATTAAVKWLHGRSQYELREHDYSQAVIYGEGEPEEDLSPAHDHGDVEAARTLLGLPGMDAELARLRVAVGAHDERLEQIEFPRGAGSAAHHPV